MTFRLLGGLMLPLLLAACSSGFVEFNPRAAHSLDFISSANRLAFGTSSSDSNGPDFSNTVTFPTPATVVVKANNDTYTAGKIAGSEDGITYFFRQVPKSKNFKLTASVLVKAFAGKALDGSTASNGQEGFGLMARDYVPQYPGFTMADLADRSVPEYGAGETGGSSNMVMVGGIKRGVRAAIRRGVVGDDSAIYETTSVTDSSKSKIEWFPLELGDYSSYPTLEDRPDFPPVGSVYVLTLEKNNSGFRATFVPPSDKGKEFSYFFSEPDVLFSVNKDYYYVGLFAARAAEAEFSNIQYWESEAKDDAPRVDPLPVLYTPKMSILSPPTNSDGDYTLLVTANVRGALTVLQDGESVPGATHMAAEWVTEPTSAAVQPYSLFTVPVYALHNGDNRFTVMFYPDDEATTTSTKPLTQVFQVSRKSFLTAAEPLYVSPSGSQYNSGTTSKPLDLDTALTYVLPGQKIILLDGTYKVESFHIARGNNGTAVAPKRIEAQNRYGAIIDFGKKIKATGAVVEGNYWVISGLQFRNTPDKVKGFVLMGANNIVEWVKTYNNGDTGLQISGRSTEPKTMWPKNNIIRYCESYDNLDAAMNDADGFAAKLTVGENNKFQWCVAHNNCDDGWDLFTKKETGTIGAVRLENCIAYQNGMLMDGTKTLSGRNGFKMGGEGLSVAHTVINSLAFQNGAHGFTSNSNGGIVLTNDTSFDNGGVWNLKAGSDSRNFTIYDGAGVVLGLGATVTALLSLYSDPDNDGVTGDDAGKVNRKEDKVELKVPGNGYVWYGTGDGKSAGTGSKNKNGTAVTIDDVYSTVPPLYEADLTTLSSTGRGFLKRNTDGTFALGNFMKTKSAIGGSSF